MRDRVVRDGCAGTSVYHRAPGSDSGPRDPEPDVSPIAQVPGDGVGSPADSQAAGRGDETHGNAGPPPEDHGVPLLIVQNVDAIKTFLLPMIDFVLLNGDVGES
jgi:hypothetical protein